MPPPGRILWLGLALVAVAVTVQGQYGTADPPTASVAVRVRVPAEVSAGTDVTYRLIAENISRAPAHHVQLKATVPANARFVRSGLAHEGEGANLLWKFGTLEPGQRREVTVVLKPTSDDDIDLCARVQFEHGQCVKTRISRPGLNVRRTGPVNELLYESVTYKLEVSNTGRTIAKNVVVEETLPKGIDFSNSKPSTRGDNPLTWTLGDIAPGQIKRIEYDVILKESGKFTFRTLLKADGVKQEKSAVVEVGNPGLDIAMIGPSTRAVGRAAHYVIVVTNTGSAALTNVQLTDELPEEIVFRGATGGRLDSQVVRWDLGTIPPGGRRAVALDVSSRLPGSFKNVCTATADRGIREQGKATTTFVAASPVTVEIERETESLSLDRETTLVVRVANTGKMREEKIPLAVTLPEGLQLIEARGPGTPDTTTKVIRFGPIDVLEPGREVTATLRVKAVKEGEHKIQAEAGAPKDEEMLLIRGK